MEHLVLVMNLKNSMISSGALPPIFAITLSSYSGLNFSNSSFITASTPGFCKPIAFNRPLGPSAILGRGFP